ncbi:MAG: hypothetical protein K2Q18_16495 [Bdellovibrionales bacterium]|nr:hypothetical protein [Bdellovibrionales bacterium]
MAKLQNSNFLRNKKGQSVVEYLLLLAVISSISFAILNNKKFKGFMNGKSGFFTTLKASMEYSYRYGRQYTSDIDPDDAMAFSYQTNKHDTYYNKKENQSRFFSGLDPYGN